MSSRPDRYDAAVGPNGSPRPATPAAAPVGAPDDVAHGAHHGRGDGADAAALSGLAEDGRPVTTAGTLCAPGWVPPWVPAPATVSPVRVPATQTPSTASTTQTGAQGGFGPEAACLPLTPRTDVLTAIPIASLAGTSRTAGRRLARGADLLERLSPSVASPLLPGAGLPRLHDSLDPALARPGAR